MLSRLLTRKEQLVLLAFAGAICLGALALFVHHHRAPVTMSVVEEKAVPPLAAPPDRLTQTPPPESAKPLTAALTPAQPPLSVPPAVPASDPSPEPTAVAVMGAVDAPGMYRFAPGDRVQDAIERAGGARDDADLSNINLAAPLIDGSTLYLPRAGTARISGDGIVGRGGDAAFAVNPPQYTITGWRPSAEVSRSLASRPVEKEGLSAAATEKPAGLINLNTAPAAELETLPGIGRKLAEAIVQYRAAHPFRNVDELANVKGIGPKKLESVRTLVTAG